MPREILPRPAHMPESEWVYALRLARKKARELVRSLPFWIDRETVEAEALVGVWKAAETWDPARGRFPTWVGWKVFGFLVEEIRRQTPWKRDLQEARDRGEAPWAEYPCSLDYREDDEDLPLALRLADYRPGPEAEVLARLAPEDDGRTQLAAQFLALLEPRSQAVVLARLGGSTWSAIAQDLRIGPDEARNRYRRACQTLEAATGRSLSL